MFNKYVYLYRNIIKKNLYPFKLSFFSKHSKNNKVNKISQQTSQVSEVEIRKLKETQELYNKLMLDIEKKKVEPSLERIYMKQLLEYLEILHEDKNKLLGWINVGDFFYENMEKLDDKDFLTFFSRFLKFKFKGTKPDFWNKVVKYLIDKKIVRNQLIPLFYSLTNIDYKLINWIIIADHLLIFDNLEYRDAFLILCIFAKINFEINHPIWEFSLSAIKKIKYETMDIKTLLNFSLLLADKNEIEVFKNSLDHFKDYLILNLEKFDVSIKVRICTLFAQKKFFSVDEMGDVVIDIFPKLTQVSPQEKEQFIFCTFPYFKEYQDFEKILKKKQIEYEKNHGKLNFGDNISLNFIDNFVKSLDSKMNNSL